MNFQDKLIIAVDFDGTIVDDAYPKIGKTRIFAFETLKRLRQDGHRLILWTYRSGGKLEEAVGFCKENGIEFYAVNASFPQERFDYSRSRKIHADLFIDDRNIGGILGWGEVYQLITNETPDIKNQKKKWWQF
ncbi:BT0820 family HAD-type phosphatase [Winogradskyella sp. UBA3174]|uniref:BT0820 family HAD-type phosphatase n=1 Tax=Winogradskyella sp. UBA3174 TaxID=1947785 RepID=UPI0025DD32D7|nr:hydrolase [Winogradskyella sp. UBA3174]|tara:strand:- start:18474 stop:18872 length:399 start_codon:yes stop_codon:yes gene_type:complete